MLQSIFKTMEELTKTVVTLQHDGIYVMETVTKMLISLFEAQDECLKCLE